MMTLRWRRGSVLVALVVLALSLQLAAARAFANGASSEDVFLVSVFDCYMPVPDGFVLNTQDSSGFSLFLGAALEAVRIKITRYNAELGSSFTQLEARNVNGLVVEELRNAIRKDIRITRIHDEKQQVMVYGGTDELIDTLVRGCLDKKHGELFAE